MIALLRQRNFGLLWFGGLISFVGDWITLVALPIYIYNLTGSVAATGGTWIAAVLPSVVLQSLAGVYVDRWDRRQTMVVANLLTVPLVLGFLLVRTTEDLWLVYLLIAAKSVVGNFMGPAENALLPKLVDETHLPTANALNTLNNNLARLIGPAIGGLVMASAGFGYAVVLDAISFVVAGLMIALIRAPRHVTRATPAPGAEAEAAIPPNVLREWLDGMRLVKNDRLIAMLFIFIGVSLISEGFFEVMITPFVMDTLGGDARELGWMMTAQAVGGLAGGLVIGSLSARVKPGRMVAVGLVLLGFVDLAVFNIPNLPVDLVLFMLAGPPVIALHTGVMTLLQTRSEDRYRGRLFGVFGMTASLTIVIGQVIASVTGGVLGPRILMSAGGTLMCVTGVVAFVVLNRMAAGPEKAHAHEQPVLSPVGVAGVAEAADGSRDHM
ncbi:MAG TPA: MFS transporter [Chloroflexia bacterium]|jgi:MFS family permease